MTVVFNRKSLLIFALIFISIVGAVLGAYAVKMRNAEGRQSIELEYRVLIENIDADFREKINKGDKVYNARTVSNMGSVISVDDETNYFVYEYDSENNIVKKYFPHKYNIEVVIKTDAILENGVGCSVDGVRIAVGRGLELRFPDFVGRGFCTDISWREIE